MSKAVVEMSLSPDDFNAGPDNAPAEPLGGSELYEGSTFIRPEGRNRELVGVLFHTAGALLSGRRTYDIANGWNGSDPIPGLPVAVLTRTPPTDVPKGKSWFAFCSG